MKRLEKIFISLGMIGVLFYFAHTILGNVLWPAYDPITMDISSLTADGAPHAELLRFLSGVYSICMVMMAVGLVAKSFKKHNSLLKIGTVVLLIMQLTSFIGYTLFPLSEDKTVMNFQNRMHLLVTGMVVFTTIASAFLMAAGFLKQEKMRQIGKVSLIFAFFITLFGALNPISLANGWNVLGLTERLVVYTIQLFLFTLSYYFTFAEKGTLAKRKHKRNSI